MDKDTLTKKVLEVFSDILPDIDAGKLDKIGRAHV